MFCQLGHPVYRPLQQSVLHLSDGGLGSVLLALPIGSMISMPVAGFLVSRFGSKQSGAHSKPLFYAIVLPLLGMVQSPWQLFAVLVLFGFTGNLANIAVNTQAVAVEAMYGKAIMASFHGLWSLAGFTGAAIGAFMAGQEIVPHLAFPADHPYGGNDCSLQRQTYCTPRCKWTGSANAPH